MRQNLRINPKWQKGHGLLALRALKDFEASNDRRLLATAKLSLQILRAYFQKRLALDSLVILMLEARIAFFEKRFEDSNKLLEAALKKYATLVPLSFVDLGKYYLIDVAFAIEDDELAKSIILEIPEKRRSQELKLFEKTLNYRTSK